MSALRYADQSGSFSPVGIMLPGLGGHRRVAQPSRILGEQSENVIPITRPNRAKFRALNELRRLRRYSAGWDGRNAEAANQTSFDLAEKFLALVTVTSKPLVIRAELFSNGTAVLNVQNGDVEGQFQFFDDGVIASVVEGQDFDWDDDVEAFDGAAMPPVIADHLKL